MNRQERRKQNRQERKKQNDIIKVGMGIVSHDNFDAPEAEALVDWMVNKVQIDERPECMICHGALGLTEEQRAATRIRNATVRHVFPIPAKSVMLKKSPDARPVMYGAICDNCSTKFPDPDDLYTRVVSELKGHLLQ